MKTETQKKEEMIYKGAYKKELLKYLETQDNFSLAKSWEVFSCKGMMKKHKLDVQCLKEMMTKRGLNHEKGN